MKRARGNFFLFLRETFQQCSEHVREKGSQHPSQEGAVCADVIRGFLRVPHSGSSFTPQVLGV